MRERSKYKDKRKAADYELVTKKLNSMLIALLIMASMLTETLVRMPFFHQISNNLIIFIAAMALATAKILYTRRFEFVLPEIMVASFAILWYLYTLYFHYNDTTLEPIQFIFYAILPIYAISQKADGEYVLRYMLYINFASLPVIQSFFIINHDHLNQAYLSNIYAILSGVIGAIIHFSLYRKGSNIVVKLAYLYSLYMLYNIILYANRGAILCLLFCLVVLLVNNYKGEERRKMTNKKAVITTVVILTAVLVTVFLEPILLTMESFFHNVFHNVPSFVTKMLRYIEYGDISDGRDYISAFTLTKFGEHPFFGYGIKTFQAVAEREAQRAWPYPHQYIYQYLFEGGILFGLLPVYFSLSITAKTILRKIPTKNEFALCCALVCVTLPKLLFSTDAWSSTTIWMLITYSVLYIYRTRLSNKSAGLHTLRHGG